MKNNKDSMRILFVFVVIGLFALAWYNLINGSNKKVNQYTTYLETAREKAAERLYDDADDYYNAALEIQDTLELRNEIADFLLNAGRKEAYANFCESITSTYPYEPDGYVRLVNFFRDIQHYKDAVKVLDSARGRGVASEELTKLFNEVRNQYEYVGQGFAEIGVCVGDICPVKNGNGDWGYVDLLGRIQLPFIYDAAGPYNGEYMAVKPKEDTFCFIDHSGRQKSIAPLAKKVEDVGFLYEDKVAVKYNGKYHYCNFRFEELFGEYDYASGFNCGVAAVKNGQKWMIIDGNGNQIGSKTYDDVKLDDKTLAFKNNMAFVKDGDKYYLIDVNGERVGDGSWVDVDAFNGDEPAAVFNGKQWGFIDVTGAMVIDYKYNDARSFCYGYAAVCDTYKWGFANTAGDVVIPMEFQDVTDFNGGGSAFVKTNDVWDMIIIYAFGRD